MRVTRGIGGPVGARFVEIAVVAGLLLVALVSFGQTLELAAEVDHLRAQVRGLVHLKAQDVGSDWVGSSVDGDVEVQGALTAGSISSRGPLSVGSNTLVLANDVAYPPESILADFLFTSRAGPEPADLAIARLDGPEFSHVQLGIGLGDPKHMLHLHNGPLSPFVAEEREVRMAFSNQDTGKSASDGLVIGIDVDGSAAISQNEDDPLVISTNGTARMTVDSNGNVGIGTSSPADLLDVAGAARVEALRFPDNSVQTSAATSLASFDSGWVPVLPNQDRVLAHGLGTTAVVGSVWLSGDAAGSGGM